MVFCEQLRRESHSTWRYSNEAPDYEKLALRSKLTIPGSSAWLLSHWHWCWRLSLKYRAARKRRMPVDRWRWLRRRLGSGEGNVRYGPAESDRPRRGRSSVVTKLLDGERDTCSLGWDQGDMDVWPCAAHSGIVAASLRGPAGLDAVPAPYVGLAWSRRSQPSSIGQ